MQETDTKEFAGGVINETDLVKKILSEAMEFKKSEIIQKYEGTIEEYKGMIDKLLRRIKELESILSESFTREQMVKLMKMPDEIIVSQKEIIKKIRNVASHAIGIGIEALGKEEFMRLAEERLDADDSDSDDSSSDSELTKIN